MLSDWTRQKVAHNEARLSEAAASPFASMTNVTALTMMLCSCTCFPVLYPPLEVFGSYLCTGPVPGNVAATAPPSPAPVPSATALAAAAAASGGCCTQPGESSALKGHIPAAGRAPALAALTADQGAAKSAPQPDLHGQLQSWATNGQTGVDVMDITPSSGQSFSTGNIVQICLKAPQAAVIRVVLLGQLGEGGQGTVWLVRLVPLAEQAAGTAAADPSVSGAGEGQGSTAAAALESSDSIRMAAADSGLGLPIEFAIKLGREGTAAAYRKEHKLMSRCFTKYPSAGSYMGRTYGWGVVKMEGGPSMPCILLEHAAGGSVKDRLIHSAKPTGLSFADARVIMKAVVQGTCILQQYGQCVHRDITADNVLLFKPPKSNPGKQQFQAKLCDFGACGDLSDPVKPLAYSPVKKKHYVAPEVYVEGAQDFRLDTWFLGLLLLELRTGMFPFWYLTEDEQQQRDLAAEVRESSHYTFLEKKEKLFASHCLEKNLALRPLPKKVQWHAYFLDV